jgi:chemotaxis family two-component system response regulator Rcp1
MEAKPVRILLVEDNPDHVFITRRALRDAHEGKVLLDHVEDGQAATDYLFRQDAYAGAPRPDLILLDLHLPNKSGLEVLREIKQDAELRRIPVVVLTTSDAEQDILNSYNLHANSYVSKPVSASEYIEKVKAIPAYWAKVSELPR